MHGGRETGHQLADGRHWIDHARPQIEGADEFANFCQGTQQANEGAQQAHAHHHAAHELGHHEATVLACAETGHFGFNGRVLYGGQLLIAQALYQLDERDNVVLFADVGQGLVQLFVGDATFNQESVFSKEGTFFVDAPNVREHLIATDHHKKEDDVVDLRVRVALHRAHDGVPENIGPHKDKRHRNADVPVIELKSFHVNFLGILCRCSWVQAGSLKALFLKRSNGEIK